MYMDKCDKVREEVVRVGGLAGVGARRERRCVTGEIASNILGRVMLPRMSLALLSLVSLAPGKEIIFPETPATSRK